MIIGCVWAAFHFIIFLINILISIKDGTNDLVEELCSRPLYHISGVLLDGIFWPISIPYKVPRIFKAMYKSIRIFLEKVMK
jgi:hypothetical protein